MFKNKKSFLINTIVIAAIPLALFAKQILFSSYDSAYKVSYLGEKIERPRVVHLSRGTISRDLITENSQLNKTISLGKVAAEVIEKADKKQETKNEEIADKNLTKSNNNLESAEQSYSQLYEFGANDQNNLKHQLITGTPILLASVGSASTVTRSIPIESSASTGQPSAAESSSIASTTEQQTAPQSIPSTAEETGETTAESTHDVELPEAIVFFKKGDREIAPGLGADLEDGLGGVAHFPLVESEVREVTSETPNSSAESSEYYPDQIIYLPGVCEVLSGAQAEQFRDIVFNELEFSENPTMHYLNFSVPASELLKEITKNRDLSVVVGVYREEGWLRPDLITLIWRNLPIDINRESSFNFLVSHEIIFMGEHSIRTRVILWDKIEEACVNPDGLMKFAINIPTGDGLVFPIPEIRAEQPVGLSTANSTRSAKVNDEIKK